MRAEHIDLADFPERARFGVWQEIAAPFFDVDFDAPSAAPFSGAVTTLSFGEAIVVHSRLSGQRYERDAARARVGPWDQMAFQLYCAGAFAGDYAGRDVCVRSGDINAIDFTRPYVKRSTDEVDINLILPRRLVAELCPAVSHGDLRAGATPVGRLLGHHLSLLTAAAPDMTVEEADGIVRGFLLVMGGTGLRDADRVARAGLRATARARVESFVRANFSRADLDVTTIARANGLSRAALYRLFPDAGGVMALVERERVGLAFSLMAHTGRPARGNLASLAERCGVAGPRRLATLLRRHGDPDPADRRGPEPDRAPASGRTADAARWLTNLRRLRADA